VTWSIGSSEAATALSCPCCTNGRYDDYGSPLALWLRAHDRLPRYDNLDTPAIRRGRGMEWGLGHWFARERGFGILQGPSLEDPPTIHPDHSWLHSRVDFYVWDKPQPVANAVADVKTAAFLDADKGWGPAGTAKIPPDKRVQMLVHLACHPKAERCWVPTLGVVENDWRVYVVERDDRRIETMIGLLAMWVDKHVIRGEAPPPDGRDRTSDALDRGIPEHEGRVKATADAVAAARLAAAKRRTLKDQKLELERVVQQAKLLMGHATELVDERNRVLATWRADKNGVRRFRWTNHEEDEEP
jgi:hypothetical protein